MPRRSASRAMRQLPQFPIRDRRSADANQSAKSLLAQLQSLAAAIQGPSESPQLESIACFAWKQPQKFGHQRLADGRTTARY